ncbi:unnamed protein product, partial [Discosporangium mesarthrocarpum]
MPRDGTIPPYHKQPVTISFQPILPPRLVGFKCVTGGDEEAFPSVFQGVIHFENADRKSDGVSLKVSGKGVRPTVTVSRKAVRFGQCPCFEHRDIMVSICNTGELPIRYNLSKMPSFSCRPPKGLLQP